MEKLEMISLAATTSAFGIVALLLWCAAERSSQFKGMIPALHVGRKHGFQEANIGNLAGKVFLVTGANTGLGFSCAKLLHRHGATVVITCRTDEKCRETVQELQQGAGGTIKSFLVDLADMRSVVKFVDAFLDTNMPIHGLILNAGVFTPTFTRSQDDLELMFAVNHMAHYYIADRLAHKLVQSAPSTLVTVSSSTIHNGNVILNMQHLMDGRSFNPATYYASSKLANYMMAQEMAQRYGRLGVTCSSVHPGQVATNLVRNVRDLLTGYLGTSVVAVLFRILFLVRWDPDSAALTIIGASLAHREESVARFYNPIFRQVLPPSYTRDPTSVEALGRMTRQALQNILLEK